MTRKRLTARRSFRGIKIRRINHTPMWLEEGKPTWVLGSSLPGHKDPIPYSMPYYVGSFQSTTWGIRKPGDFGIVRIEKRSVNPAIFTKITDKRARPGSAVYSVCSAWVEPNYRGQGYGLLLYLQAVEYAARQRRWLTNDITGLTSPRAYRVWRALDKYVEQWKKIVVRDNGTSTVYAARGLNKRGEAVLARLRAATPHLPPGRIKRGEHARRP